MHAPPDVDRGARGGDRPRRWKPGTVRTVVLTLASVAAVVIPFVWVFTGGTKGFDHLVPTERILHLEDFLGDATVTEFLVLMVAAIAALVLVWLAICLASWTCLSLVERVRKVFSPRRRRPLRPPG